MLNYLRDQGIICYMVTGDDWNTALAIGSSLGIESKHIFANAKPKDKEIFVISLQDYEDIATGKVSHVSRRLFSQSYESFGLFIRYMTCPRVFREYLSAVYLLAMERMTRQRWLVQV